MATSEEARVLLSYLIHCMHVGVLSECMSVHQTLQDRRGHRVSQPGLCYGREEGDRVSGPLSPVNQSATTLLLWAEG